jgi:hypothetical protein
LTRTRYQPSALAVLVAGAALIMAATAPAAAGSPGQVRGAAAGSLHLDMLAGAAATSRANAWAVGCKIVSPGDDCGATLIEHWNGRQWTTTGSPGPGRSGSLAAVSAVSRDDAWAVGSDSAGALALHWNGHRWQRVPTASLGTMNARLDGVAAVTAKDAWAVGYAGQDTLIEHWNGTRWLRAASPDPSGQDLLGAVTAIAPDDIWAVGEDYTGGSTGDTTLTLAERWNGSSWTQVPAKNPGGTGESYFSGVSAISPDSIWAVGVVNSDPQDFAPDQTLAEHWNGSSWQVVPSPDPGRGPLGNDLNDVAAISAKDAWAVGVFDDGSHDLRLAEHWNGKKWNTVPVIFPAAPKSAFDLSGITALSASQVWAVGSNDPDFAHPITRTVIARWNGTKWTRTPSPNP